MGIILKNCILKNRAIWFGRARVFVFGDYGEWTFRDRFV